MSPDAVVARAYGLTAVGPSIERCQTIDPSGLSRTTSAESPDCRELGAAIATSPFPSSRARAPPSFPGVSMVSDHTVAPLASARRSQTPPTPPANELPPDKQ